MRKFSVKQGGLGVAVAAATLLMGATGVSAGEADGGNYATTTTTTVPDLSPAITPTSSTQTAGGTFDETVSGCQVGETVTFTFNGATEDVTCASAGLTEATGGTAVATLTAPAAPGTYNGNAFLNTSNVNLPFQVIVEAATVTPTLPATGSDSNQVVPVAIGLILAGAGLVSVAAIRRRSVVA